MKVNITQAVKLTGKSRTTLYNHLKSGKLSAEYDDVQNRSIEISELERVYGKLKNTNELDSIDNAAKNVKFTQLDSSVLLEQRIQFLQEKVDFLETELERERSRQRIQVDVLQQQLERERGEKEKLLGIVENQTKQITDQRKKRWWF